MVMRRSAGGFGTGWSPPRGVSAKLAIALVVGSVVNALGAPALPRWLMLVPDQIFFAFALWQPLTYAFIEVSPLGVIFGALITWSIGGALEASWGAKRVLWFALGTTAGAGVLTVLLSLLWTALQNGAFPGGTVMTTVLWVGYGLAHSRAQLNFWGLPLSGTAFAGLGVGFVLLNGVFGSWAMVIPDLFGVLLTAAYLRLGSPKRLLLRFQSWRFQRQVRARSKHLRVIGQERNMPPDSDKFLH